MIIGGNSLSHIGNSWSKCDLGDIRLNKRAEYIGSKMLEKPGCPIPYQMENWASTKSCYRFLDNPSVSYAALTSPHFIEAKTSSSQFNQVLCIHDTSEVNFGLGSQIEGLSRVGMGLSKGFLLHTSLGIVVSPFPKVIGLLSQEIYYRQPEPKNETKKSRYNRARESDLWINALRRIGASPNSTKYVDIMDRGADIFRVIEEVISLGHEFIIRAAYNRNLVGEEQKLFDLIRETSPLGTAKLVIRRSEKRKKRLAKIKVACKKITIKPSYPFQNKLSVTCAVVYAKERNPPVNEEPIEWVVLTSLNASSLEECCKVLDKYAIRWIIEEYHKCLKTGCKLEFTQLKNAERIERLLGFLSIAALKLLQIKEYVKETEKAPAKEYIDTLTLEILAKKMSKDQTTITLKEFWLEVAKMGGFLARKSDGYPGWITIWRGWMELQHICEGAKLARCG